MPIPMKRIFNVIADKPDDRDRLVRAPSRTILSAIPDVIDRSNFFGPVYDQGDEGSCTGNGWAAALDAQRSAQGLPLITPSRQFIYGQERIIEGDFTEDGGAQVRTGAKVLAHLGAPPESMFPYTPIDFTATPGAPVFAEALKHKIAMYERVPATPDGVCAELAKGFAVVMGFTVFASFESNAVAKGGILAMPKKGEKVLGGHCTVFVGHHITKRNATTMSLLEGQLKVRNSWGADWGNGGYFTMPFGYLTKGFVSDCWAIRAVMG